MAELTQKQLNIISRAISMGFEVEDSSKVSQVVLLAKQFIFSEIEGCEKICECDSNRNFTCIWYYDSDTDEELYFESDLTFICAEDCENIFYTKNESGEFVEMNYDELKDGDEVYIHLKKILNSKAEVVYLVAKTRF